MINKCELLPKRKDALQLIDWLDLFLFAVWFLNIQSVRQTNKNYFKMFSYLYTFGLWIGKYDLFITN